MKKEFDTTQENALQAGGAPKRRFMTKRKIIALSIVAVIILLFVWDIFIDPPAFWRFERQKDKKAILEYVENNYPDAKRLGGKFPLQMPAGPFEDSIMYFGLDGIDFSISAWDGEIIYDEYYTAKAEKYIRENFIDGFMNDRGLTPDIEISFIIPPKYYGIPRQDFLDNVYSFEGSIHVTIKQAHIDGVSTPKEVGWFYDFYQYWMENCDLPICAVTLTYLQPSKINTEISSYNVDFQKGKVTFSNKDDFYNNFTA